MPRTLRLLCLASLSLLALACGDDEDSTSVFGSSLGSGSDTTAATTTTSGDGDGDPTTTTSTSTSGDGDGDPTTTGDPTEADPLCGNGIIDAGEECDGTNLAGSSCPAQGFDGGTLACDPTICVFVTTGCTTNPGCDANCNNCPCPSAECTMCCAGKGKIDTCGGGSCGCF